MDTEQQQLPKSPFAEDLQEEEPLEEELPEEEEIEEDVEDEEEALPEEEDEEIDLDDLDEEELEELLDEFLEEEEAGDDEEEADVPEDMVPHAALHKERQRRKELQQTLQGLQSEKKAVEDQLQAVLSQVEQIKAKAKELGLDDEFNWPQPLDPEKLALQQEKAAKAQQEQLMKTVEALHSEAVEHLEEFPYIDANDNKQSELILGYALLNTLMGTDIEDSVLKSMELVNKIRADAIRTVRKTAPKKKQAARPARRRAPAVNAANVKGPEDIRKFFDSYAANFIE